MGAIQVKNVPPELHEAIRQRAAEEGVDLGEFVLEVLQRELSVPSRRGWLAALRRQPPVTGLPPAAELLSEARAERGADAGRR